MKRSTKIIIGSVLGLGLISAVTAKQFGNCDGGAGFSGSHRAEWMTKRISNRLNLNDTQQMALTDLRDSMLDRVDTMRGQRDMMGADIQSLLNNEFDQLKAQQLIEQKMQTVRDNAPEMISAFAGFYDQLDADQQEQVRKMLEQRMSHRGMSHRGWNGQHEGSDRG